MNRSRKTFVGVGLAILVPASIVVAVWANTPAKATLTPINGEVQGASTQELVLKPQQNDYMAYRLPERFVSRTRTDGSGSPIYLQQLFGSSSSAQTMKPDQFALTIAQLPSAELKEISGVQFRQRSTDYEQVSFAWLDTSQGIAFQKKTNSYELAVFVRHGDFYASLVQSGLVSDQKQIEHELGIVVGSIQWDR